MRRSFLLSATAVFFLLLFPTIIAAADATLENGIDARKRVVVGQNNGVEVRGDFQVGPTRFVLDMDPGEERTVQVMLLSRQGEQRAFGIDVEDFNVTDDGTDSIQFYGRGDGPFSARSWIQPAVSTITLNHGEQATIPVKITVPRNASVGDHYSVVLFRREPNETADSGFNLISRVGALLLITVRGEVIREGTMQQFLTARHLYWSLPAQFAIQYRNTGTVHIVPTGKVEIRNIFGITVDEIPVKDWYVLRNSTRRRELVWQPRFALGYYTANLTLTGANKDPVYASVSFWVIPALPVLLALIAIFAVSFLVQAFFGRFEIRKKKE
jgi:hypothetical protein